MYIFIKLLTQNLSDITFIRSFNMWSSINNLWLLSGFLLTIGSFFLVGSLCLMGFFSLILSSFVLLTWYSFNSGQKLISYTRQQIENKTSRNDPNDTNGECMKDSGTEKEEWFVTFRLLQRNSSLPCMGKLIRLPWKPRGTLWLKWKIKRTILNSQTYIFKECVILFLKQKGMWLSELNNIHHFCQAW